MKLSDIAERVPAVATIAAAATLFAAISGHAGEASGARQTPTESSPGAPEATACGPKLIAEVTVATLNRTPIVTLLGNGLPMILGLDTGAERTVITPAAAGRIGAQPPRVEFSKRLYGATGGVDTREVELRSFAAGPAALRWRRMLVAPISMPQVFSAPLDGVLGADVLGEFDIGLDLPHYRMGLYRKQSCPEAAPDWPQPYTGVETGRSAGDHLFFPVRLDGRALYAFIDTGAQRSFLVTAAASFLGVTAGLLARDPQISVQGVAPGRSRTARLHRFSELQIGDATFRVLELAVTDVALSDGSLVLGIDFLHSRRVWLSYGSRRIFVSTGSDQEPHARNGQRGRR